MSSNDLRQTQIYNEEPLKLNFELDKILRNLVKIRGKERGAGLGIPLGLLGAPLGPGSQRGLGLKPQGTS